jgi:orotate phosphoribosyltransferase
MEDYKQEFIEFMVWSEVLTFGDFVTKSGRPTPYFINTGRFDSGMQMARLGVYYSRALRAGLRADFDCLFGPAYKGIPLATATAVELATQFAHPVRFCYNRKEVKDHGEGGALVGHTPCDGERIVIIEDVTTAGTSIRETVPILRAAADVRIVGLVVAVDRQEKGPGGRSALAELQDEFGFATFSIVTLDEILAHLSDHPIPQMALGEEDLGRIEAYRAEYGA